jgi:hypothetical protein
MRFGRRKVRNLYRASSLFGWIPGSGIGGIKIAQDKDRW